MKSFRTSLALRMAVGGLALFAAVGITSLLALRTILNRQLDGTLLHLAEVEAQAGAAVAGSDFQFHEGVLLAAREGPTSELTRYAQLWTSAGTPVVRSRNLTADLDLPAGVLEVAKAGRIGWDTHTWQGKRIRSVVYPLELVGMAHQVHLLQVAAPTEPVRQTLASFSLLLIGLTILATGGVYALGRRIAGVALQPTGEITEQAEAITAGLRRELAVAEVAANLERYANVIAARESALLRFEKDASAHLPALKQMAEDAYRLGRSSIFELLDSTRSRHDLTQRRIDLMAALVEAQLRYLATSGELERSVGLAPAEPTRP